MAKKFSWWLGLFLLACLLRVQAQNQPKQFYLASGGELIFSFSDLDAGNDQATSVLRFSPFFNFQAQVHYDFTNAVGVYSGLGVRNVGFINKFADTLRIKERSYSLGIPLVLKLGNLQKGFNVGVGAEIEWMFAWKRKVILNDNKTKYSSWFSSNVNTFNPSVMLEIKYYKGYYVRFKYYLDDFLKYNGGITLPNGVRMPDYALSSKMFYVSFGMMISKQTLGTHATNVNSKVSSDAYFKETNSKRN